MRSFASLISFAAILCCVSNAARATVFTASNGAGLAARAEFTVVGSNLTVLLTNTSSSDVLVPAQILTAVFFNGNGILTPSSAVLPSGSTVFFDPQGQPSGGIVGGEWAYSGSVSNSSINGMGRGIGSAGFGIFGAANFPGPNLDGNPPVQGLSYGITSAGDNTNTGNTLLLEEQIITRFHSLRTVFCLHLPSQQTLALRSALSIAFGFNMARLLMRGTYCHHLRRPVRPPYLSLHR